MRIQKRPDGRCLLVLDEVLDLVYAHEQQTLIDLVNQTGASRKSFDTWLFNSVKSAEEFVFIYNLKHGKASL